MPTPPFWISPCSASVTRTVRFSLGVVLWRAPSHLCRSGRSCTQTPCKCSCRPAVCGHDRVEADADMGAKSVVASPAVSLACSLQHVRERTSRAAVRARDRIIAALYAGSSAGVRWGVHPGLPEANALAGHACLCPADEPARARPVRRGWASRLHSNPQSKKPENEKCHLAFEAERGRRRAGGRAAVRRAFFVQADRRVSSGDDGVRRALCRYLELK